MSKQSVYTVHSGDECGGDPCYDVLKGPGDFECWLTEPEDRSFWRDLSPVVERLESLEQSNTQLREQNRVLRLEFQSLLNAIDDSYDEDLPVEIVEARNKAQAALTATSQPKEVE